VNEGTPDCRIRPRACLRRSSGTRCSEVMLRVRAPLRSARGENRQSGDVMSYRREVGFLRYLVTRR